MKKSYSHYQYDDLKTLALDVVSEQLFQRLKPLQPSDLLIQQLINNQQLPLQSEKAKSELLITPVLNEVWLKNPKTFTYFSGYQFNVDNKRGLKGFCDYILCKKHNAVFIESPLCAVVEAKHNQDLLDAVPQCAAEMYAAQLFNEQQHNSINTIYGIVTTGYDWLFLKLIKQTLYVDNERYFLNNLPQLLACWQAVIDDN